MARQALGMGLKALIPDAELPVGQSVQNIRVDLIIPNPYQPRKEYDQTKLQDLVESIKEKGVVQPVLLRFLNGKYQLIAGERRFQAVKIAQFKEIPAIVREADDREMLEIALIENIQREDLNPIDEAAAYHQLMEEFSITQEIAAKRVGKDRSTIANAVRLLKLPASIQQELAKGIISVGHARALLSLDSKTAQEKLCSRIQAKKMTVRETEEYIRRLETSAQPKALRSQKEVQIQRTEEMLQQHLGTKVMIKKRGQKGYVQLAFASWPDLERLLQRIGVSVTSI